MEDTGKEDTDKDMDHSRTRAWADYKFRLPLEGVDRSVARARILPVVVAVMVEVVVEVAEAAAEEEVTRFRLRSWDVQRKRSVRV